MHLAYLFVVSVSDSCKIKDHFYVNKYCELKQRLMHIFGMSLTWPSLTVQ